MYSQASRDHRIDGSPDPANTLPGQISAIAMLCTIPFAEKRRYLQRMGMADHQSTRYLGGALSTATSGATSIDSKYRSPLSPHCNSPPRTRSRGGNKGEDARAPLRITHGRTFDLFPVIDLVAKNSHHGDGQRRRQASGSAPPRPDPSIVTNINKYSVRY